MKKAIKKPLPPISVARPPQRRGTRVIDEQDVHEFKLAARAFLKKATSSKSAARAALQEAGIVDSHGHLTKNYR